MKRYLFIVVSAFLFGLKAFGALPQPTWTWDGTGGENGTAVILSNGKSVTQYTANGEIFDLSASNIPAKNFTFSFWTKDHDNGDNIWKNYAGFGDGTGFVQLQRAGYTGKLNVYPVSGCTIARQDVSGDITDALSASVLKLVTLVQDNGSLTVYVNGESKANFSITGWDAVTSDNAMMTSFGLGCAPTKNDSGVIVAERSQATVIADCHIYNFALTSEQVGMLYYDGVTQDVSGTDGTWANGEASAVALNVIGEATLALGNSAIDLDVLIVDGAEGASLKLTGTQTLTSGVSEVNTSLDVSKVTANLGTVTVAKGATLTLDSRTTTWTKITGEGTVLDIADPTGYLPVVALNFANSDKLFKDTGALNLTLTTPDGFTAKTVEANGRFFQATEKPLNKGSTISLSNVKLQNSTITFWGAVDGVNTWKDLLGVNYKLSGATDTEKAFYLERTGSATGINLYGTGALNDIAISTEVDANLHYWTLVVSDVAENNLKIYIDGKEAKTLTFVDVTAESLLTGIGLGGSSLRTGQKYSNVCSFADVRVYNVALDDAAVKNLCNAKVTMVRSGETQIVKAGDEAGVTVAEGGTLNVRLKDLSQAYTLQEMPDNKGTVTLVRPDGSPIAAENDSVIGTVEGNTYTPSSYDASMVYTWVTSKDANITNSTNTELLDFHKGTYQQYADGTTVNGDDGEPNKPKNWQMWQAKNGLNETDSDSSLYKVPGFTLRFVDGYQTGALDASFNPISLGGLIVESGATGYTLEGSIGNYTRVTELGDVRGTNGSREPTYFTINENFTIDREGSVIFYGPTHFRIAEGKTLTIDMTKTTSPDSSTHAVEIKVTPGAKIAVEGAGIMKFVGENLTFDFTTTGDAAAKELDLSGYTFGQTKMVEGVETPIVPIDGKVAIDATTILRLPALAEGQTSWKIATSATATTGLLMAEFYVGGERIPGVAVSIDDDGVLTYTIVAVAWTGAGTPVEGAYNWDDADNWRNKIVPGSTDDVEIDVDAPMAIRLPDTGVTIEHLLLHESADETTPTETEAVTPSVTFIGGALSVTTNDGTATTTVHVNTDVSALASVDLGAITIGAGKRLTVKDTPDNVTFENATATLEWKGDTALTTAPSAILGKSATMIFNRPVTLTDDTATTNVDEGGFFIGHGLGNGNDGYAALTQTITVQKDMSLTKLRLGHGTSVTTTVNHTAGEITLSATGDASEGQAAIIFGHWSDGKSVYNLSGGSLTAENGGLRLGHDSPADVTVSGGILKVATIGGNGTQNTTMTLSGTGRLELGEAYASFNKHTFTMEGSAVLHAFADATVSPAITLSGTPTFSAAAEKTLTVAGALTASDSTTVINIGEPGATGTVVLSGALTSFTGTVKVAAGATLHVPANTTIPTLDLSEGGLLTFAENVTLTVNKLILGMNRTDYSANLKVADGGQVILSEDPVEGSPITPTWGYAENATISVTLYCLNYDPTKPDDEQQDEIKTTGNGGLTMGDDGIHFDTTLDGKGAWAEWLFENNQVDGEIDSTGYQSGVKLRHNTFTVGDYVTVPDTTPTRKAAKIANAKFWYDEGKTIDNVTENPIPFNEDGWKEFAVSFFAKVPEEAGEVFVHFGKVANLVEQGSIALVKGSDDNVYLVRIPGGDKRTENSVALATMSIPNATTAYHLYTFVRREVPATDGTTTQEIDIYLDDYLWRTYKGDCSVANGGIQFGKVSGSFDGTSDMRTTIAGTGVTIKAIEETSEAAIDMLRVYNCSLTSDETKRIAQEGYDYTSPNPIYRRTLTDATEPWVKADAWTNTETNEQVDYPAEGARMELIVNTTTAVTLTMPTPTDAFTGTAPTKITLESLIVMPADGVTTPGIVTLAAPVAGETTLATIPVEVKGLTHVSVDTTVESLTLNLLGAVTVAEGTTLSLEISAAVLTGMASEVLRDGKAVEHTLTGAVTLEGEGESKGQITHTIFGADYLPAEWNLTAFFDDTTRAYKLSLEHNPWYVEVNGTEATWKVKKPDVDEPQPLNRPATVSQTVQNLAGSPVTIVGSGTLTLPGGNTPEVIVDGDVTLDLTWEETTTYPTLADEAEEINAISVAATTISEIEIRTGHTLTLKGGEPSVAWSTPITGEGNLSLTDKVTLSNVGAEFSGTVNIPANAELTITTVGALGGATKIQGAGKLVVGGAYTTDETDPLGTKAGLNEATWTGTVSYIATGRGAKLDIAACGNATSEIEFNGATGFIPKDTVAPSPVRLTGNGLQVINGSWANGNTYKVTFGTLLGDGKLKGSEDNGNSDPSGGYYYAFMIGDASNFEGSIDLSSGTNANLSVVIGADSNFVQAYSHTGDYKKSITVLKSGVAKIAENKTWAPATDGSIKVSGTLGGAGTLNGAVTFSGDVILDASSGGTLTINGALTEVNETLIIKVPENATAGTDLVTFGGTAIAEADKVLFANVMSATGDTVDCFAKMEGNAIKLIAKPTLPATILIETSDEAKDILAYEALKKDVDVIDAVVLKDSTDTSVTMSSTTHVVDAVEFFEGILEVVNRDGTCTATVKYDFGIERMTILRNAQGKSEIVLTVKVQNALSNNTATFAAGTGLAVYVGNHKLEGITIVETDGSTREVRIPYEGNALFDDIGTYPITIRAVKEAESSADTVSFVIDVHTNSMPVLASEVDNVTLLAFTQTGSIEALSSTERTTFSVTLEGDKVNTDPTAYTLTVDGNAATLVQDAAPAMSTFAMEEGKPSVTLTFTGFTLLEGSVVTLTAAKENIGASIAIKENSWSDTFNGTQSFPFATMIANTLVADGFVDPSTVSTLNARTGFANGSNTNASVHSGIDPAQVIPENEVVIWTKYEYTVGANWQGDNHLIYRIPAMATNGKGEIVTAFDVRYGSGDSGDHRHSGIDLGGSHSTDGGVTWKKPYLAVDVSNLRGPNGLWYNGTTGTDEEIYTIRNEANRESITPDMDVGDPSMLYDPTTKTYWLMAITGGGLSENPNKNGDKSDVVLYKRATGAESTWGNRTSIKNALCEALGLTKTNTENADDLGWTGLKGILQGPGHGIVTSQGWLVFPMQYFGTDGAQECFAAISKDNGTTWEATARTTERKAQENCIVELDDRSLYMMCKGFKDDNGANFSSPGARQFYRATPNEPITSIAWTHVGSITQGIGEQAIPHVQGSFLKIGKGRDGRSRYVLAHDLGPGGGNRSGLALVFGRDITAENASGAGIAWDLEHYVMLHEDATDGEGYNSMCMIDENTLGIIYEAKHHIYFERIDIRPYLK